MFDISKLSVMTREHSFNTIHQILNCFTNCFYLLFSFRLYCSLCRYLLGQLLVSWVKPFRAANRMFKTGALKITETFLYLHPEIKFISCIDSTAKCWAADSINSVATPHLKVYVTLRMEDKTENSLQWFWNISCFAVPFAYHSLQQAKLQVRHGAVELGCKGAHLLTAFEEFKQCSIKI